MLDSELLLILVILDTSYVDEHGPCRTQAKLTEPIKRYELYEATKTIDEREIVGH